MSSLKCLIPFTNRILINNKLNLIVGIRTLYLIIYIILINYYK